MDCDRILKFIPSYLQENDYFKSLLDELTFQIKKISVNKLKNSYHFYVPIKADTFFPFTLSIARDGKVSLSNSWIDIHEIDEGVNIPIKRFSSIYCEPCKEGGFSISNRDISIETMQIDKIRRITGTTNSVEIISEPKDVKFQTCEIREYDETGALKSISVKKYTPEFVINDLNSSWEEVSTSQELSYRHFLSPNESVMYVTNLDTKCERYYYITGENGDIDTQEDIDNKQYIEYLNESENNSKRAIKALIPNKK